MHLIIDGLVKGHQKPTFVIPVKLVLDLIGERESSRLELVPGLRRDDVWNSAGVYPALDAGRG